ncbi:MAG: S-adenosylmethionine:tRNA ribosyltransferase-isomerase, partial [Bacteroidota bacterium]
FHQPESTLLFLVASFLGIERWKAAYQSALDNDYRFLSYGDSSLLWH